MPSLPDEELWIVCGLWNTSRPEEVLPMTTTKLKEATYDNIVIPEEFGPIELLVDDHFVKRYAFTVDDYNLWAFADNNPFGSRIGQAALLADDVLKVFFASFDQDTVVGLHTEEQLWFDNPVFVGERVTLSGRYVDKYVKRGDGHVVLEAQAFGADGRSLIRHRGIEIMRIDDGHGAGGGRAEPSKRRVTGNYNRDLAEAAAGRLDLQPGTPLVPIVKRVTQEQMSVFSARGSGHKGLHNDLEIARRAGLPTPIAQGQMQTCYIAELLTRFFGPTFYTSGWFRLKFLNPVFPGDVLTVRGAVTGAKDRRLELEVWVNNDAGKLTAAGWASAEPS
jgi:acyl dehydratase